jgi:antitoxin ParD1/3/4
MANRVSLNVSLTPRHERFIADKVSSGQYQSSSEVVRDGLRLLEEQEDRRKATREELRQLIEVGFEEARRGELVDGEEFMEELRHRHELRLASTSESA